MEEIPDYPIATDDSQQGHFKKFVIKEMLDKVGFGFGSQQFINILLFLSGASIFFVGVVNGLKSLLIILFGIFAQQYNKLKGISKKIIGISGIFFGFSFLFMAAGNFLNSPWVFSIALLLSGMLAVLYGNFSQNFFLFGRRKEILEKIAKYGLMVTAISLFLAAYFLDNYGDGTSLSLNFFGNILLLKLPGYIIIFEVAAIAFIVSGYFLASVKDQAAAKTGTFSLSSFADELNQKFHSIFKKKFLTILLLFNIIVGLIQVLGNSYYGIFIYNNFRYSYFGGFLNVAVIFLVGVFSSLIGYFITKINVKSYGMIFMLAVGSVFLSAMPFAYYLGSSLAFLTAGTILGVIGASALGVSTSMFVIETLDEGDREYYYIFNGIFSLIPYAILIPVFSYIAQVYSLATLFWFLGAMLMTSIILVLIFYGFMKKQMYWNN